MTIRPLIRRTEIVFLGTAPERKTGWMRLSTAPAERGLVRFMKRIIYEKTAIYSGALGNKQG